MKRFASKEEWSEAALCEEVDSLSLVPVCVCVGVCGCVAIVMVQSCVVS